MSSNSIIFITGANTGLGFEIVRALCQSSKSYTILLGGRNLERANNAVQAAQKEFPNSPSVLAAVQIDIEDDTSISQAFELVEKQYGHLDTLINNAGAAFDQLISQGQLTMREAWNKSWAVNTTGTQILTHTFVPLLLKSSDPRLLFITSGLSTLGEQDNTAIKLNESPPKGWPKQAPAASAYRASKTGMNMMMVEWARILKEDGVKVWCISPGFLATGLGYGKEVNRKMGAGDPAIGGDFIRSVVEGARDEDTGKVVRQGGNQPW